MKEEIKIDGIIYKATNIETNEVYIGATTRTVRQRRLNHEEIARRGEGTLFHEAIATYGPEIFLWEQVDTATSIDDLAQKEKHYILEYDSKNNGYNSDVGAGFKKTIYQYSISDGRMVDKYNCLEEAANAVNVTRKHISKTCLSKNQKCANYFWSYEPFDIFKSQKDKRRKRVLQFSLDGKLLNTFESVAEASRQTGINITSIAKVSRFESSHAGNYKWEYE